MLFRNFLFKCICVLAFANICIAETLPFSIEKILAGDLPCIRIDSGEILLGNSADLFLEQYRDEKKNLEDLFENDETELHAQLCLVADRTMSPRERAFIFSTLFRRYIHLAEKDNFSDSEAVILYYIFKYMKACESLNQGTFDSCVFHKWMSRVGNLENLVTEEVVVSALPPEVLARVKAQVEDIRKDGPLGSKLYLCWLFRTFPAPIFPSPLPEEEKMLLEEAQKTNSPFSKMLAGAIELSQGNPNIAKEHYSSARNAGIRRASLSLMIAMLSEKKATSSPFSDAEVSLLCELAYEALREKPIGLWTYEWAIAANYQQKKYEEVLRLGYFIHEMSHAHTRAKSRNEDAITKTLTRVEPIIQEATTQVPEKRRKQLQEKAKRMYKSGYYESPIYECL